jgi:hypothetical protein
MATLLGLLSAFCASSAPTLLGRLEAMLAKMSTLVPLPSFSSLMVSAGVAQQEKKNKSKQRIELPLMCMVAVIAGLMLWLCVLKLVPNQVQTHTRANSSMMHCC